MPPATATGGRTIIGELFGNGRTAGMTIDAPTGGKIFHDDPGRDFDSELHSGDIVVLDG